MFIYIHYCFLIDQDLKTQKTKCTFITGIITLSLEVCKDEYRKLVRKGFIDPIKHDSRLQFFHSSHLFSKGIVLLSVGA